MQITKIEFTSAQYNDGLGSIKMERLGSLVILAGKNGCGKTRLLNRIAKLKADLPTSLSFWRKEKFEAESQLSMITDQRRTQLKERIDKANANIKILPAAEFSSDERLKFVYFIPDNTELENSTDLSPAQREQRAHSASKLGADNQGHNTLAYIHEIQDHYYYITNPSSGSGQSDKDHIEEVYDSLKKLIKQVLGTDLSYSGRKPCLFNLPIAQANLSKGQKMLLKLCVAIHAQRASLHNIILLLDEPENHLHPAALIETMDRIRELVTDGQIWIATHSVNLLAHLDTSAIWYMEDGEISYAGKEPEKVLAGLLGNEEQREKISMFLHLPAEFAAAQFCMECLDIPLVVQTGSNDPQTSMITKLLSEGSKVKMLDYGAGKGRLVEAIYHNRNPDEQIRPDQFDYVAFDSYDTDKDICTAAIEHICGTKENRYFNDERDLQIKHGKESFDVIVMCNVLHEIPVKDWSTKFLSTGMIMQSLKEEGCLLVVEDQLIPIGEKAHQGGFIILDELAIRELFSIESQDTRFQAYDKRNDRRLMAYLIQKPCLRKITSESIKQAIQSIAGRAMDEIKKLRTQSSSYRNGRLHALWSQQYVNAHIALKDLCA